MPYGTLKVDNITYTSGGSDASTSVSGIVGLAAGNFNNVTATGTISGVTVTGTSARFTTVTGTTAGFTTVTGTTITGTTVNANSANFTSNVTGVTFTGTTVNANSAKFTSNVTGVTFTGTTVNANSANFTSNVTGVTFTGTTVNANSANFTTSITGTTVTGTTANFSNGNFTGTVSGTASRDTAGNVRDIPQNSQTTSYQLVASDAGKHIFTTAGVTVPSGVFVVGQAVSIYNNTAGNITITQGTNVTLRQAGASGTGNRTLAQRGLATVLCVSGSAGTEFVIGGAGIS